MKNQIKKSKSFILASSSPRRFELLSHLGIKPIIKKPTVDESKFLEKNPELLVKILAEQKALDVYENQGTLLAADTIVVCNNEILGKPEDKNDAIKMWTKMSDNIHFVYTGYCILTTHTAPIIHVVKSKVKFIKITSELMDAYLKTNEWKDKAGGYAIQGISSFWIEYIDGSYTNVMGLPLAEVATDLMKLHPTWDAFPWA